MRAQLPARLNEEKPGHLVNREQSKGWRAWIAMVDERAEALALMQRSLGFMVNRKLGGGFASWREYVYGKPTDDPMAKLCAT